MRIQGKISRSLAVALLTVSGLVMLPACSTNTKVGAAGVKLNGEIDESATPQAQTRQRVIFKLMKALNEGATDKGSLAIHAAGIEFREEESKFLEGHAWLARWDFDGPVSESDVPVVLYFSDKEFDYGDPANHIASHRVYKVVTSGSKAVVSRVR